MPGATSQNSVLCEFAEFDQPVEKPLYASSGSPSRAQKPAIAVFWPCCLGVRMRYRTTDWSNSDFFNRLSTFQCTRVTKGRRRAGAAKSPRPPPAGDPASRWAPKKSPKPSRSSPSPETSCKRSEAFPPPLRRAFGRRDRPIPPTLDLGAAGFVRRRSRYGRIPQEGSEPSVTPDLPPPPTLIV